MNSSKPIEPTDDQQLGLWQPQNREEIWGAAWYWIWLSEITPKVNKIGDRPSD